jgi:hypothetical protein
MRAILLASAAVAVLPRAFMSEICETVVVKVKGSTDPVRVNKSDFDADQAKGGKGIYTLNEKATDEQTDPVAGGVFVPVAEGLKIPPAPSAPAFVNPVSPTTATADTLFVTKGKGAKGKFFVVGPDAMPIANMKDIDPAGYETEELAWAAVNAVKKQPHEQGAPDTGHTSLQPGVAPLSEVPPAEAPKS